ncbi:class I SAM-dependent methyltransferase [Candidatus Sumerlaeota bacterium]|nr:class I SAM-dependent methyltransferase [Candidatus Sumerlaeota bacterium]
MPRVQATSTAAAPVADHFTGRAAQYSDASASGIWNAWRAMERRAIWRLLRPMAGERILDAGCGAGYYSRHLLACGVNVCSTDLSLSMARETARRLHVPAFVSNLEQLPISTTFDAVLCAGALEFCGDPAAAITGMARLIAPHGRLVLMLPADGLGGRFYRRYHARNGLDIKLFSRDWLSETARSSGMNLTQLAGAGFNHVARCTLS